MLGGLVPLPLPISDSDIDRIIERVLTNDRVEMIAQRLAQLMREAPEKTPGASR